MARKGGKDRGSVEKPKDSGKWWVRLLVTGRERWYRCENKSQAKALYGRIKAEIREGKYFPEKFQQPKAITLRAWISRYLEGSTNRNVSNERRYGRFWSLLFGKRLLTDLSTDDLRRTQARLKAKGRWSPATINRYYALLRHALTLAVKDGKIDRNPVCGVKFFPEVQRTRFYSDAELTKLRKLMAVTDWSVVAFAVETGLRRQEQFQLRWDQVDMEAGVLTIPLPKGGKTRHVPISDAARAILESLDTFLRSPWVFPSPKNALRHWNPHSFVIHVFNPALRQAGITGGCWHTLRHTAASRRVMAGVDLVAVKDILGHRDIQTTLRYAHLSPGHLRDAVNRGSLVGTGSKTGSEPKHPDPVSAGVGSHRLEEYERTRWLGD